MNWFETWVDVASGGFMGLFESMSFSSGMSEWFLMELNIPSVLSNGLMVSRVWKFMRLNDKWSLMWLNNFSMWVQRSVMEFSMADIVVANIVMFRGEMSVLSRPFVAMTVVDNVSKTMVSKSVSKTMAESMVNTMVSIMRSKSMMWLLIEAVLSMMSFISILSMGIVVVWIKWSATLMSNLMSISLIVHIMGNFGKVV
jgi:hypothetical protein